MESERPARPLGPLFHGTNREVTGGHLLPAPPGGDIGDPEVPAVFASSRFDFSVLFSVKTPVVTHISAGSCPYLLVIDRGRYLAEVTNGRVFLVDPAPFIPIQPPDGREVEKWYATTPVPVSPDHAVQVGGPDHLVALGVDILCILPPDVANDPQERNRIAGRLRAIKSREEFTTTVDQWVHDGLLCRLGIPDQPEPAAPVPSLEAAGGSAARFEAGLERFFDSSASRGLDFRIRTRLTHGIDHACRSAIASRILYAFAARHGLIPDKSPADLVAVMTASFFHDSARRADRGPDDTERESAQRARAEMLALGFSPAEADTGRDRLLAKMSHRDPPSDIQSAILHTADVLELMRSYVGDLQLAWTRMYRPIAELDAGVMEEYCGLAAAYAAWLRSLWVWGLSSGRLVGPSGTLAENTGPQFNAVAVYQRSLGHQPYSTLRQSLRAHPVLEDLYTAAVANPLRDRSLRSG